METNSELILNNFNLLITQNGINERQKLVPPIINPIFSYLNSEESQQIVCFDGYYYVLTRANDKRAYYKCRNNLCTGRGVSISGAFTCIKFHKPGCTPQALMCDNMTAPAQIDECHSPLETGLDDINLEFTQYDTKPDVESLLNSFSQFDPDLASKSKPLDLSNLILPSNVNLNNAMWQPFVVLEPLPRSILTDLSNDSIPGGNKFTKTSKNKKHFILIRYDEGLKTSYYKCRNFPCGARGFCKADDIIELTAQHDLNCRTVSPKRARSVFKRKDHAHYAHIQTDWSDEISETGLPQPKTNQNRNDGPEIDLTKMLQDMGHLEAPTTDIKFIRSNKGRAVLCHGPHQYTQHHRNYKGHTFYYKCRNKDCNARGILKGDTFVPTKGHDSGCDVLNAPSNDGMSGVGTGSSLHFSLCPDVGEPLLTHAGMAYRPNGGGPSACPNNKIYYACTDPECSGRAVLTFRPVRSHAKNCRQIRLVRTGQKVSDSYANTIEGGSEVGEYQNHHSATTTSEAADPSNGFNTTGLDEKTGELFSNPPPESSGITVPSGSESCTTPYDPSPGQITYIASSNGKPMAYHLGYLYINDRNYHDHMYYRCHRAPHCPGRGKIIGSTHFDLTQMHNHPTDVNKYMGLETRNKLKEAVLSNPGQSLKKTYDEVMNRRKLEVANIEAYPYALPRYKTVQRSMGKLLNKIRLAFPNYREMFYN